ncbi:folate-dependent phosphoribosylglycinamide formyltransferase PurN [Rheinheimera sp. A13L]|uniref:formyltransferase family protein n=1 Tax=Rheinheimera sp. A13L TaxID=506534 RepID=UPI0002124884|nr:formyltransferase family protein [Rheinheimera sp. A13L]EGM78270.1 folate-dependent phosphoribosylglycinamide formyltransferase PurN [Rheinheimera sp. A13L]
MSSTAANNTTPNQFNLVVCASGGGGNFQAIIDKQDRLAVTITKLIVDRPCGAVQRAQQQGIAVHQLNYSGDLAQQLLNAIPENTNLIVLAGFIPILPAAVCKLWHKKIINTHPSLLPGYGGKGMYGVKVQEAVMQAKEKYAGCTVHYVDSGIDTGEIILQKAIEVDYRLTPWELGGLVFKEENKLLVDAIQLLKLNQAAEMQCN